MEAVSCSEARENLKSMIDEVVADRAPLAITRQRGEGAVLVSASEWASIEETLYLLRPPKNAERLLEVVRGFGAGEEGCPFLQGDVLAGGVGRLSSLAGT